MGSAIVLFFTYSYFSWLQLAGTSPGSPVVKLHASTAGLWVTFLVGEIRCHGMSPSSPKPPQTIQVWVTHNLTIQWWFLVMLWSIFTSYFLGTYLHFFFSWLHHLVFGLLIPLPRIEPEPSAVTGPQPLDHQGVPSSFKIENEIYIYMYIFSSFFHLRLFDHFP